MSKIKIAIADDFKIFRDGIKVGLNKDKNLEVVLEADNGEDLLQEVAQKSPDVIIMDLKMPIMDGIEATVALRKKDSATKVLVVTMYDDEKFIMHLMQVGANGYLLKNADPEEITKAIYSVYETGYYFNEIVNKALLKRLVIKGNIKPSFKHNIEFTEREMEILKLICEEKTATEIGKELLLSPRSVEGVRVRLIEKTGVRNTAGLAIFAAKNGII